MSTIVRPGALIAIEGLDSTGKSTLINSLQKRVAFEVCHSPSSAGEFGQAIYALEEEHRKELNPLARQLLHLASHAEMYHRTIIPKLAYSGVVMDRNWLSTFAYGVAGGLLETYEVEAFDWWGFVQLPAMSLVPDLVVLMLEPHREDDHNTPELEAAYLQAKRYLELDQVAVVSMPKSTKSQQLIMLMQHLQRHGLLEETDD